MKRRILAMVCLFCLLLSSARADLKRGSSGAEVEKLQQQLIDVGALNDTADGKFGKKTEKAVKDLQGYFGQKRTGKADRKFMDELSILWYTLEEEEISSEQYSEEEMEEKEMYCYPTEAEVEYCPRHEFLGHLEGMLDKNGRKPPEGVRSRIYQRIILLGYREILAMYDVWEDRMDDTQKSVPREQKEKFITGFEDVFGSIENYKYPKPWLISLNTWEDLRCWIMLTLVNECYDLYRVEPNTEPPQEI